MVVLAVHRPGLRIGMQLGPVTHAVLHHACCPVVLVPVAPEPRPSRGLGDGPPARDSNTRRTRGVTGVRAGPPGHARCHGAGARYDGAGEPQ
ncbi:hypothetical protein NKH77_46780 [Streptomyces sp. M19]